jgi:hypothetical protein
MNDNPDHGPSLFERMMAISKPAGHWRVEQQVKSRLGTLMWLPVGDALATCAEAERQAARLYGHNGMPTRVVEAKP